MDAETNYGENADFPLKLSHLTIPFHISSSFTEFFWMAMDQKPCIKCREFHWNPIGGKIPILAFTPLVTVGEGFHSNALHVNHPESCMIG